MASQRSQVFQAFKLSGLTLEAPAARYILDAFQSYTTDQLKIALENLLGAVKLLVLSSSVVPLSAIQEASRALENTISGDAIDDVMLIGAAECPNLEYDGRRKTFIKALSRDSKLLTGASLRSHALQRRFAIIMQLVQRYSWFQGSLLQSDDKVRMKLVQVSGLKSGGNSQQTCIGMLVQMIQGEYWLVDSSDSIKIDLSQQPGTSPGLFCEHMVVLVEGKMLDGIFVISGLILPQMESRAESLKLQPTLSLTLYPEQLSSFNVDELARRERERVDSRIIVLSDLWLDSERVWTGLTSFFSTLEATFAAAADANLLIFLVGNFSKDGGQGVHALAAYTSGFNRLAALVSAHKSLLKVASFVIIPGPSDPSPIDAFPRPPLPPSVIKQFTEKVPGTVSGSNPMRLRFFSQEIVFFRDGICNKLRRASRQPDHEGQVPLSTMAVRSIVSQAHLLPLPSKLSPVIWAQDHALSIYPLPHILFLCDDVAPFDVTVKGCRSINPGSFATEFGFTMYQPSEGAEHGVEACSCEV